MTARLSQKTSSQILLEYCKDINEWPCRWAMDSTDLQAGKNINEYFKLFLIDRIKKNRAKSTVKIYARYLWVLGGELIRCMNEDSSQRQMLSKDFLLTYIDNSGGPFWQDARDDFERVRYDSVCKQLFKLITDG